ncbi:Vimentin-type intermediate filament-associated coiled-coil protein [Schistosoma japonicum]|uniref:SJCHGC05947 protein n=1 Tax=Schistosoma japonicum TaxID=6182 RepID=Q5DEF9_SCHJA|nr:SJCHGC05947 protein [Schistosoma japonicum]TNN20550.1 Vimentin-type intermediate filament-associated coiled-coil protein [Schistosoma japonicum]
MWFSGTQPKTHIEEANRHLSALTNKIRELETQLKSKEKELNQKEEDFGIVMQEIHVKREAEINNLNDLIFKQNVKLQRLERDLLNRDSELSVLRKRCRMFDEVLRYKATLAKLTITMEQAEQYANLTAKSYPLNVNSDFTHGALDVLNTDPSPLILRDVCSDIDMTKTGSFIEQGGKTFTQIEGQQTKTLAHTVSNGQL